MEGWECNQNTGLEIHVVLYHTHDVSGYSDQHDKSSQLKKKPHLTLQPHFMYWAMYVLQLWRILPVQASIQQVEVESPQNGFCQVAF